MYLRRKMVLIVAFFLLFLVFVIYSILFNTIYINIFSLSILLYNFIILYFTLYIYIYIYILFSVLRDISRWKTIKLWRIFCQLFFSYCIVLACIHCYKYNSTKRSTQKQKYRILDPGLLLRLLEYHTSRAIYCKNASL